MVEEVSNEVEGVLFFSSRRHHCEFFYKLHEFFGTYKVRDPVIVYFSSLGKKYLFEEDVITKEAVLEFIKKAQGGNLPVYY